MKLLQDFRIVIDEREVLRYQGYKKHSIVKNEIVEILTNEIDEGYKLIKPKTIYTQVGVIGVDKGLVKLDNGQILDLGSSIEDWGNSSHIGIAICTIGSALEKRVSELFSQGELAPALMLDSVGSVAAENVANLVNYFICQRANRLGMRAGARFSPGYGRWNLSDQKVLFYILDGEKIGVNLNNQCMMLPRKSVSFCLGIGQELVNNARINSCRHCNMKECRYRKGGRNE